MKGMIFNIQRFSVNDGPGIRTTVFLKGCPLHCRWCHNPESISPRKELMLRQDRCVRCGDCRTLCRNGAIGDVNGEFVTSREVCLQCGECVELCYSGARELVGKEMTVAQVLLEIERDRVFFDQSGGGASFSGGEPLLQHEFLLLVLEECRRKGIHTVVDTAGFVSPTILERVSRLVDLFLYDVKTLDDAKHRDYTGVSNRIILENLGCLSRWGKNVIVRVPVIPGVNDDLDEIRKLGLFIASLGNVHEIQVLPYHRTGVEKYQRLGNDYQMPQTVPPSGEKIETVANELRQHVASVCIGG